MHDRWAWVNNVYKASAQLDMVANLLGNSPQQEAHALYSALGAAAAEVAPGCDGLVIERMLAGQEDTFLAQLARAQQAGKSNGHIYRAVMEALAQGMLALLQRAQRDGAQPSRFVAAGGGVYNRHFLRLLAAMIDAPIEVAEAEAGLIGAGIAAATGGGWYASLPEAMAAMTASAEILYPDAATSQSYRQIRQMEGERG
jgi:sugar (pentulose or hexulose) kinase